GIMSNEEEKRCPLCAEEMDWTDQQIKPCKCGYEVLVNRNQQVVLTLWGDCAIEMHAYFLLSTSTKKCFYNKKATTRPTSPKGLQFGGYMKSGGFLLERMLTTTTLGTSMVAH
ncbi:hypothetical protein M8C21_015192, partial [Ambrosia artemisiifolia]